MTAQVRSGVLFPREEIKFGADIPQLAYYRPGDKAKPLLVFLAGGMHLARLAYGHPAGERKDFLDYWTEQKGLGLLALSYPSDHPVFERPYPELNISGWVASCVAIIRSVVAQHELTPSLIVAGWSMSGRTACAINVFARDSGLKIECFIALAATLPFPGLSQALVRGEEPALTPALMWDDGQKRHDRAVALLRHQSQLNGHTVIPDEVYHAHYAADTPPNLLGSEHRLAGASFHRSIEDAVLDQKTFDLHDYPITGIISALDRSDARHSLVDSATWSFINVTTIFTNWLSPPGFDIERLSAEQWARVQQLMRSVPERLTRSLDGTHFFFVGEKGARETADHIASLFAEVGAIRRLIGEIAGVS